VTSLDTRIILEEGELDSDGYEYRHLIITPYPTHLIRPWRCKDGKQVLLRPAKPDDEPMEKEFFNNLTETALRNRFMGMMNEMSHDMLSSFCNIDYDREMTIIAEYQEGTKRRIVGTATMSIPADSDLAEFSVVIAEDFEGTGLALKLCDVVVGIAQEKQLKGIHSFVLGENTKMLGLAKRLGFTFETISTEEIRIVLEL
jgi:acetyltransferase